ncbi:MAG: CDP-alcohol phosphatidyltransferase family protein [Gemmatimonadales bacterium]
MRLLREGLGLTPDQVSWASLGVTLGAAFVIADGRVGAGLILMAVGQLVDAMDGAMARIYQLASPAGKKIDTMVDRLSEAAVFAAFAGTGLVSWTWAVLALVAILLLTSVSDRSHLDPGAKRFALYFGLWFPYSLLFKIIFGVNLAAYVVGLIVIDCMFQKKMDALGGDLDTVASRAAALEGAPAPPA